MSKRMILSGEGGFEPRSSVKVKGYLVTQPNGKPSCGKSSKINESRILVQCDCLWHDISSPASVPGREGARHYPGPPASQGC